MTIRSGGRAGILVLAAFLATGSPAAAQTFTGGTKPYVLQGKIAADQTGARQSGWFPVSIGTVGQSNAPVVWVGVTAFVTWNDDPFEGREVLRMLMPNQPTLLMSGPPEVVAKLQQAPPGNKVVVRGVLVPDSRNFMLSSVHVLPPSAKMPD